jgi:hypothetical protein
LPAFPSINASVFAANPDAWLKNTDVDAGSAGNGPGSPHVGGFKGC